MAVRQALSTFLAVVAVITLVFGVLYLYADGSVPWMIQGRHSGHHLVRAGVCLGVGAALAITARLLRGRRRA